MVENGGRVPPGTLASTATENENVYSFSTASTCGTPGNGSCTVTFSANIQEMVDTVTQANGEYAAASTGGTLELEKCVAFTSGGCTSYSPVETLNPIGINAQISKGGATSSHPLRAGCHHCKPVYSRQRDAHPGREHHIRTRSQLHSSRNHWNNSQLGITCRSGNCAAWPRRCRSAASEGISYGDEDRCEGGAPWGAAFFFGDAPQPARETPVSTQSDTATAQRCSLPGTPHNTDQTRVSFLPRRGAEEDATHARIFL